MKRFLPAALLVAVILTTAPVMGSIRDALFGGSAEHKAFVVKALAALLVGLALACIGYALLKIRHHRWQRYSLLAAATAFLCLLVIGFETDLADVSVAEKIHIVEYGLLACLLYRALRPREDASLLLLPLLWSAAAGTLDESVQWFFQLRVGEIRDVLLNVLSAACGLLFALALDSPDPRFLRRLPPAALRTVQRSLAVTVLILGSFFCQAHLGHMIDDPEIGRFRSWYSRQQLLELTKDRTARWSSVPPDLSPWNLEDHYLSEAAFHASHRNHSYSHGDPYRAWQANRILEKYYGPFLDLSSFRGAGRHRYPPEARAELEARVPARDPRRYLSPVHEGRVFHRPPKSLLLSLTLGLAGLIWFLPWRRP